MASPFPIKNLFNAIIPVVEEITMRLIDCAKIILIPPLNRKLLQVNIPHFVDESP
jgi:hypothetical protein